ncbi:MAG: hypothetical protein SGARI_001198 [Bacillariaceae sp.]
MRADLIRKETPDEGWRKGLLLSPPRKAAKLVESGASSCRPRRTDTSSRTVTFATDPIMTDEYATWLSEDERASMWYSNEEYALMKRASSYIVRIMATLQSMEGGEQFAVYDEELCMRGLEAKTRVGARQRRHNILRAIDTVLSEQERQLDMMDLTDGNAIAQTYHNVTTQSSIEAWLVAQKDARAAKILHDDEALRMYRR